MKSFHAFLLLFILVAVRSKTCKEFNPLLKELETKGVKIFDTPQSFANKNVCNGMWLEKGTCCDYETLVSWTNNDRSLAIRSEEAFGNIQELQDAVTTTPNIIFKPIASKFESFSNFMDKTTIGKIMDATRTCINHMKSKRSSALCYVCAADSSSYFIDNKAAVSIDFCNDIVQACGQYFKLTFPLLDKLDGIVKLFLRLPGMFSTKFGQFWVNFVNHFKKINQDVSEIDSSKVEKREQLKTVICNSFFNVVKTPLMAIIELIVSWIKLRLQHFGLNIKKAIFNTIDRIRSRQLRTKDKPVNSEETSANTSRQLSTYGSQQSFNFDAIKDPNDMLETDTRVIQVNDKSSSNTAFSSQARPMNLSLTFP